MMDIFFQDPDEVPLPPGDVRIRELTARPWAEGDRVRVYLEVDPFQRRPNVEISIHDQSGKIVAEVDIIETITRKMELNMHLRLQKPAGSFQIKAVLYYPPGPPVKETEMEPSAKESSSKESSAVEPAQPEPERVVVDQAHKTFEISAENLSGSL